MSLNQKQRFLFYKLIRSCIEKRGPVGSKLLAKKIKNKLSPPSLRIYLRKIAESGYLENVGDLGRLPTDKGWYYYLENYDLKPEIKVKVPDVFDLDLISELTKNIVFLFDDELKVRGLKNVLAIQEKEIIEDMLGLVENLEKIIENLKNDINILIGEKIKESKTKKLSLLAYKNKNKIIGFLGPKINYYHAHLSLLKKIKK
jgi:transcriptional regulator of heat shock response